MDLKKMLLPSAVEVEGNFYEIKTSHPYWFTFASLMKKQVLSYFDFDFLYVNKKPKDRKKGFEELCRFFQEEKKLPRVSKNEVSKEIALDYELDADLIYAAILEQYHVDLFEKEIHWHKVRAMIDALHNTKLNEVIGYRLYTKPSKDETYEKSMEKLKHQWHIMSPEEEAEELRAKLAQEKFSNLLKGKK